MKRERKKQIKSCQEYLKSKEIHLNKRTIKKIFHALDLGRYIVLVGIWHQSKEKIIEVLIEWIEQNLWDKPTSIEKKKV